MADLIDSYAETNGDSTFSLSALHPTSSIAPSGMGQSFTCSGSYKITSAKFHLKKWGSPTGNAHAVLYAHSGTYGSSSVPTGDPLATSDDFDVSTLTTSFQLITFSFTGAQQYQMSADTKYCIVFENPTSGTIDSTNRPRINVDLSSPIHSGNYMIYTNSAWGSNSTRDVCFYVYGDIAAGGETHTSSDTAKAYDSITFAVEEHIADAAKASDSLTTKVEIPLADIAKSSDGLTTKVEILLFDTAKVSDSLSTKVSLVLSDIAKASDGLITKVSLVLSDIAKASDTIGFVWSGMGDVFKYPIKVFKDTLQNMQTNHSKKQKYSGEKDSGQKYRRE